MSSRADFAEFAEARAAYGRAISAIYQGRARDALCAIADGRRHVPERLQCGGWFHRLSVQVLELEGRLSDGLDSLASFDTSAESPLSTAIEMERGFLLCQMGNHRAALPLLTRALEMAKRFEDPLLRAHIDIRLQNVYHRIRDYWRAAQCGAEAVSIGQAHGCRYVEVCGAMQVARSWRCLRKPQESLDLFMEIWSIAKGEEFTVAASNLAHEIGVSHLLTGRLDEALEYMEQGRRMKEEMGLPSVHFSLANIGSVYLKRRDYGKARALYEDALALATAVGDRYSVARWTYNLALTYRGTGDGERASALAGESAELYAQCGDSMGASEASELAGSES